MRLGILYNPAAGRGRARHHVAEAERHLRELGADVVHLESRSRDDLISLGRRASRESFDRVVACGGDGTVHLALRELDLAMPMAVLPLGSGDDFAKTIGIPSNLAAACRVAVEGKIAEIDVAVANGIRYVGVAGVGFDSIVAAAANRVKVLRGSAVYLWSIFKVLPSFHPIRMRITIDDRTIDEDVMFAVVGNTHRYGGGIRIAPAAVVDDGILDVYVVARCSKWDLIRTLPRGYTGTHVTSPFVRHVRGRNVRIETSGPFDLNADGELVTTTPAVIGLAEQKLKVVVPGA
jgi:diacylglycerol kinase (ATP)